MDSIWQSMAQATVWDWIWHIIAVIASVYISVPGLWWPYVEKYRKKKAEQLLKQEQEQADTTNSN